VALWIGTGWRNQSEWGGGLARNTHKAFKIEMINRIVNTASSGTEIYWYSPEIKAIVKAKPSWKPGTELLSYNVVK
jgi:hypothetical protein